MSDLDVNVCTPLGFVEYIIGSKLYPWQDAVLAPLELATGPNAERVKISCVTPNGAGKSERLIACAALYWAGVHKRGKVVITTKDQKQLNNQVIPALEKHMPRFGWHSVKSPYYKLTTPSGGVIHAFVTDEASRAEGWHKGDDIDEPLLMIVDEAKSINETIFQAIYRCGFNALMLVSSPGLKMGHFYDSHTKLRDDFYCVQAGLNECPHIPREKVADIIKTYGEHHPFTRSSIYGEFMDEDDGQKFIVPLSSLLRCYENPPKHKSGLHAGFCDFAAGGDENVFAVRDGNKVELAACWKDANKMASVGRFIREFVKSGLAAHQIYGDAAAKDMLDSLAEGGWPINRINFGSPAYDEGAYISWGAEAWLETGQLIEKCEVILPDDDKLKAQLTTRHRLINARGKLCIEDKHSLRKRNIHSPDRGDAVCGVLNVRNMKAVPWMNNPDGLTEQSYTGRVGVVNSAFREYEDTIFPGADAGI